MTDEQGTTIIGVAISFTNTTGQNEEQAQKQLGKYRINKKYEFCYECWLDSLFGNQKGEGDESNKR